MDAVQLSSLALQTADELERASGQDRAAAQEHLQAIARVCVERGWVATTGEFIREVVGVQRNRSAGRPADSMARAEYDARTGRGLTAWMYANAAQAA